jgi:hypothetical protein
MDAHTIFRLWTGPWRFARTIVHAAGRNLPDRVYGRAHLRWLHKPNNLRYRENGFFYRACNLPLAVRRQYVYRYEDDNNNVTVYFGDTIKIAGLFHTFVLTAKPTRQLAKQVNTLLQVWHGHGEHICGMDKYETQYQFIMENDFLRMVRIVHSVKGPQKDYRATALYVRYATMLRHRAR